MASGAISPSSSPRLPSPPPIAEDQSSPQSPLAAPDEKRRGLDSSSTDNDAGRRIRPGTKAIDMLEGPPVSELSEIDSAFQLSEYLKALYQQATHPPSSATVQPITPNLATQLASVPPDTEPIIWLHELCRFLVQKLNIVVVALFSDSPPCSAATCSEMRASEWQYLCAVHDPPKSCCAIDYCCHTLDWAANTLTSPAHFPSRLSAAGIDAVQQGPGQSVVTRTHQERQLTNIFRRVYRIFAHAWFSHREVFWKVESKYGLYVFFKTVCDAYGLIEKDNYTIPPEAENLDAAAQDEGRDLDAQDSPPIGILKRENTLKASSPEGESSNSNASSATARRQRHVPSKSGSVVSTVVEENEEDDAGQNDEQNLENVEDEDHTGSKGLADSLSPNPPDMDEPEPDNNEEVDALATWMKGDIEGHDEEGDDDEEQDESEAAQGQYHSNQTSIAMPQPRSGMAASSQYEIAKEEEEDENPSATRAADDTTQVEGDNA